MSRKRTALEYLIEEYQKHCDGDGLIPFEITGMDIGRDHIITMRIEQLLCAGLECRKFRWEVSDKFFDGVGVSHIM